MKRLLFDLECDNLLDKVTKIHCIVTKDIDNGELRTYVQGSIEEGIKALQEADHIYGHNIVGYDLPVLLKLHSIKFDINKVTDTLVLSRLLYTELKRFDYERKTEVGFPKKLAGSHSLEAWGHRLGEYKEGTDITDWSELTPEMLNRCISDIKVNEVLLRKFLGNLWDGECVRLEHEVASVIQLQEQAGVAFNEKAGGKLYSDLLAARQIVEWDLKDKFQGWYKNKGEFTPKVNNKKQGYTKGCSLSKIEWVPFNPQSRPHLVHVLKKEYNWKPIKISDAGNALMDEAVLKGLSNLPGTKEMLDYLMISKRISQLAEGRQAWLKLVTKEGLIHGRVNPNGAITGRMSHFRPNVSQVPAVYSPYGKECRSLFTVRSPANFMVGADADGLELRCLAHYLYPYDGGRYARTVLYGNKEEGTDAHSLTLRALGELCKDRDMAKTFFYALIYGAGDYKFAKILGRNSSRYGKAARARVEKGITGLGKLRRAIQKQLRERKRKYKRQWLTGLDGRKIFIRSEHAALNSLLQSAGGVIMKKALVILDEKLTAPDMQMKHGEDFYYLINSHDEWQIEVVAMREPGFFGRRMCSAMEAAGEHFNLNVPITGEYKIGKTWAETH